MENLSFTPLERSVVHAAFNTLDAKNKHASIAKYQKRYGDFFLYVLKVAETVDRTQNCHAANIDTVLNLLSGRK